MFLDRLAYFGGFLNLPLNTSWHGINVLSILEFCLVAMLLCTLFTLIFGVRKDRNRLISWALAGTVMFSTAAYAANTALSGLTASGALAGANLIYVVQTVGSGGVKATMTQVATFINSLFSGDATVAAGGAVTLATVNANVGSFGTATTCVSITVNAKGLITAASAATCTPAVGSVTGFGTGVATALGVNINTAGSVLVNGGGLGTPSSGVGTNLTGTAAGLTAGTVTTNANLTGDVTSAGNATTYNNVVPVGKGGAGAVNGLLKANGSGTVSQATAGTDYSTIDSLTPGSGLVSGITASCTQTALTATGTLSAAQCIDARSTVTETINDSDRGKIITFSNAGAVAASLAQAGTASAFANGWFTDVVNNGAGTVTITPTTSTIKGTTTLVLTTGQGARIYSDGTNYQVNSGSGSGGTGISSITPGAGVVSGVTASCTQTAITTSGTLSQAQCVNAQTGTTYAFVDGDRAKLVTLSNAASIAVTIAQAGTASSFANGWFVDVTNKGAGTVTITPTTSTINGNSTLTLTTGQGTRIFSDGTNYQIQGGSGGGTGTVTSVGAGCGTSTGGSPITTTGNVLAASTLRANSTTSDTIVAADCGNNVTESNASSIAVAIAQAGTTGFAAGTFFNVCNIGVGTATITPTTSTIGGASILAIPGGSAAAPVCYTFQSDGTNYNIIALPTVNAGLLNAGTIPSARLGFGTNVFAAAAATLSSAGGLTSTIASGTAALGTGSISSAACATVVTVTATNVATTDTLAASFNGDPTAVAGYIPATAGTLTIFTYPTSGNVNFKVCNSTASPITPGAITLNWRVVR